MLIKIIKLNADAILNKYEQDKQNKFFNFKFNNLKNFSDKLLKKIEVISV